MVKLMEQYFKFILKIYHHLRKDKNLFITKEDIEDLRLDNILEI